MSLLFMCLYLQKYDKLPKVETMIHFSVLSAYCISTP